MALPLIFVPSNIPLWLIAGHSITPDSPYEDTPMLVGEWRKRRLVTDVTATAQVSVILEAAEMLTWDTWYEDTLHAGVEHFTARIANIGPGLVYYDAQWLEPYVAEPMHLGRWQVSGALLLTGRGQDAPPSTGVLELEIPVELFGSNTIFSSNALELEIEIELGAFTPLRLEIPVELGALSFELRDDGGFELRDDDSKEERDA